MDAAGLMWMRWRAWLGPSRKTGTPDGRAQWARAAFEAYLGFLGCCQMICTTWGARLWLDECLALLVRIIRRLPRARREDGQDWTAMTKGHGGDGDD